LLVLLEVTDRVLMEEELRQSVRALDDTVEERTALLTGMNEQLQQEVVRRTKAEHKISGVARELTATLDTISDFVSVHDRDFRIVRANRALADFVGVDPKDLIGRQCHDLLHGTAEPPAKCPHVRAIQTGATVTEEIWDPQAGIQFLVTCSPFLNPDGEEIGSVHVARDISKRKRAEQERENLIAQLQEALSTVKILSGLLPICSSCKKIRDNQGSWRQVEEYIGEHSDAEFTHGICPECMRRLYPEYVR
jgi:PAS domain S-box-containing protein